MSLENLKYWEGTNFVTDPTWGDNGKGKVVDLMAQRAHMVIRTNGGANAGHTVKNNLGEFKFHLIPSGIFNPNAICILADTVVINPTTLTEEIISLRKAGIEVTDKNLLISENAHLVMPWHIKRDNLRESSRGSESIGTTGRGIGPAYADRTERVGLRLGDLLKGNFIDKFEKELVFQEKLIVIMGAKDNLHFERSKIVEELVLAKDILAPMITTVLPVIWEYHGSKKRILGEAGQGVLLDLDRGGYPDVTSSHPGIAGFNLATGIGPKEVTRVIAVSKAYTTRVGAGPFPTELNDEIGTQIQTVGHEFGATTGRPRRCGWLDVPALRHGLKVGGANSLALTKIDIFDSFPQINICVGYKIDGREYALAPRVDNNFLSRVEPIYETCPGWNTETGGVKSFRNLPENAQRFILRLQSLLNIPIELVSVGPDRESSIYI